MSNSTGVSFTNMGDRAFLIGFVKDRFDQKGYGASWMSGNMRMAVQHSFPFGNDLLPPTAIDGEKLLPGEWKRIFQTREGAEYHVRAEHPYLLAALLPSVVSRILSQFPEAFSEAVNARSTISDCVLTHSSVAAVQVAMASDARRTSTAEDRLSRAVATYVLCEAWGWENIPVRLIGAMRSWDDSEWIWSAERDAQTGRFLPSGAPGEPPRQGVAAGPTGSVVDQDWDGPKLSLADETQPILPYTAINSAAQVIEGESGTHRSPDWGGEQGEHLLPRFLLDYAKGH